MKVGTDSIMLGSWTEPGKAKRILDIGTGSGILALMMAQKSLPDARIVAIDIDSQAVKQASINGQNCPWPDKIEFTHTELQHFSSEWSFDLIISNPPYFVHKHGELGKSDPQYIEQQRRTARHTIQLPFEQLLLSVSTLLAKNGVFTCVLPVTEGEVLVELAKDYGLSCVAKLRVASNHNKPVTRVLLRFSFDAKSCGIQEIVIRDLNSVYTKDYKKLCKDFYLNF